MVFGGGRVVLSVYGVDPVVVVELVRSSASSYRIVGLLVLFVPFVLLLPLFEWCLGG